MAKDYKDRGERRPQKRPPALKPQKPGRWILIGSLIFGFLAFLIYLKSTNTQDQAGNDKPVTMAASKTEPTQNEHGAQVAKKAEKAVPIEPEFTFYTLLPKGEVVVPEHEIKTRILEERTGKVKSTQYTLQAGAFRDMKDADHLKAELAMMGLSSKIEKALIGGNATWYRVKLGPYTQLGKVEQDKSKLKKSGIDAILTEANK